MLNWSWAVTVKVKARARRGAGGALTAKCVAAAALTLMLLLVPVIVLLAVSVAVSVWLPAVFERGAERAGAVGQRAVGGQDGLAVAAGEVDRAGVAGGRVVERVLRRHREVEGAAGCGAAGALTVKWVAAAALTAMVLLVPVMLAGGRVGGRDGLVAGRDQGGAIVNVWTPLSAVDEGVVGRQRRRRCRCQSW